MLYDCGGQGLFKDMIPKFVSVAIVPFTPIPIMTYVNLSLTLSSWPTSA
jgi:hypothetical protein